MFHTMETSSFVGPNHVSFFSLVGLYQSPLGSYTVYLLPKYPRPAVKSRLKRLLSGME